MRKNLRCIAAMLALVLAVSMTGCGTAAPAQTEGTMEEVQQTQSPEKTEQEKKVTLGKVEDGVYTNAYTNITFAPEGWTMAGADDLQEVLGQVGEVLEGTEIGDKMEGVDQIMDMQAADPTGLMNVNVVYTKMGAAERLANMALNEDAAMDAVLDQKDTVIASYEAAGITVESMEKAAFTYGGQQRIGIKTVGTVQGISCYILQAYERTLGAYSVVTTMTSFQEDHTEEMAELFKTLNP